MMIETFYSRYFKPGIVCTDSRKIKEGDIFIALKGENFNGEDFAELALNSGAAVVVVSNEFKASGHDYFRVNDPLLFLQQLAQYHRQNLQTEIIGLTGTNGKTTTKELTRSVLSQKYRVQSTVGNLNNHIGVPLTLLKIQQDTQIAIIEMGANHPGEIKALCAIARPDCGLVTNIGKAHLEGFGGFEGVIKTKSELYESVKSIKGKIYFNGADNLLTNLISNYPNTITYNKRGGICSGKILSSKPLLSIELSDKNNLTEIINTSLFGNYNLDNIFAAAAIGLDHGLTLQEIKKGVEAYTPESLRSQSIEIGSAQLILDCYNANPTSMKLALQSFAELAKPRKIVILGGMRELGPYERQEHLELAKFINTLQFDFVILSGKEFRGIEIKNSAFFNSNGELKEYLQNISIENSAILIKGSRANKLEELVDLLKTKI